MMLDYILHSRRIIPEELSMKVSLPVKNKNPALSDKNGDNPL